MSSKRLLFVAGLAAVVATSALALPPVGRAADSPEWTAAAQDTIRNRKERKARLHALAQERRLMVERMIEEAAMFERMQIMAASRMQQMQALYQSFLFESQRTGTWNHCSQCRTLVSPYASVGQSCPFCGASWRGVGPGWFGR